MQGGLEEKGVERAQNIADRRRLSAVQGVSKGKTSKGRSVVYAKPSEQLLKLGKALERSQTMPPSKLEVVKLSLNEWLDFFEQEKQKMDLIWSGWSEKPEAFSRLPPDKWMALEQRSSALSLEISRLNAQALEHSVELDLMTADSDWAEVESLSLQTSNPLTSSSSHPHPRLARYHQTLESILEASKDYQTLTQQLQNWETQGV